jgi:hypothetical protein
VSALSDGGRPRLREVFSSLDGGQRRSLAAMAVVVVGLHVVGFVALFALVARGHYRLGAVGTFSVGVGVTAYTLGLRALRRRAHGGPGEDLDGVRASVRERFGYVAHFTHHAIVGRCIACEGADGDRAAARRPGAPATTP